MFINTDILATNELDSEFFSGHHREYACPTESTNVTVTIKFEVNCVLNKSLARSPSVRGAISESGAMVRCMTVTDGFTGA